MNNSHESTSLEIRGLLPKHQGKSWRLSKACTVNHISSMQRFCAFHDAASHAKFNHLWPASSPLALVSSVSFTFPSSARSGIFSSDVSSIEDAIFVHFVETVGTWAKQALWNEQNLNVDVYHVQRLQHISSYLHTLHILCASMPMIHVHIPQQHLSWTKGSSSSENISDCKGNPQPGMSDHV